ncbi:hypothetical protein N9J26_01435 [bacterium]|nr:hypothetical protein [bacterium]
MTSHENKIIDTSGKLRLQYQSNGSERGRLMMRVLAGADKDKLIEQALCGDAKVLLGQIAKRVLKDHADAVVTCPHCGYVLRTPKAKQCRECFKSWR